MAMSSWRPASSAENPRLAGLGKPARRLPSALSAKDKVEDGAGARWKQSRDDPQQRGFRGSASTQQRNDFPAAQLQVDRAQDGQLVARGASEALAQRLDVDEDIGDSEAVRLLRLGRVGNAIICGLFRR
jgi:hypothetical protein